MKSHKKHKKILPSHHSGKLVHRRHTSYASLVLVMLLAGSVLSFASRGVSLAATHDPETSGQSMHAVVPGKIPTAPQFKNVVNGTAYTSGDPIRVDGSCPDGTLIKVFKNEVFAGSAFCEGENFALDIDLFISSNTLIARAYNANNAPSPDSVPVVVTRTLAGSEQNFPQLANQFFITSDVYYKGVNIGEELKWPITLAGGQPPYAVNIGWGEGKTDLISRKEAGTFEITHKYTTPGKGDKPHHTITVTAVDQLGTQAFLQTVMVVNGSSTGVISSVKQGYDLSGAIRLAWQAMFVLALIVLSFWLGERREAYVLNHVATSRA